MAARFSRLGRGLLSAGLLLSALALYGANRDRAFVAAPYLGNPRANGVSIFGITREPCRWTVAPLTPGSPQGEEAEPARVHRIDLDGLAPGREVDVQVLCDGAPVEGGKLRFRTDPGPNAQFEFAVVGDSGGYPNRLRELWGYTPIPAAKHRPSVIVERMSEARPQLVLHAGDVAYPHGRREDFARAFFRPFGPLIARAPIAAAIGNHDLQTEGGLPFLDAFGGHAAPPLSEGKYYSFEYGPLHVCVLNSNDADADLLPMQTKWLAGDLRSARRPWKVILTHVPLHWAAAPESGPDRWEGAPSETQRNISAELLRVCVEGGASVIFCGHQHWYERSTAPGGVPQFVTGAGGEDVRPVPPGSYERAESAYHFLRARVEGDGMTVRAVRADGSEIEGPDGVRVQRRK